MYAWNEFDEGGWLAPLRQGGSARLDAIRQVVSGSLSTDTMPPVVSITSPAHNAIVHGTVTVSADVSDDVGVGGVQFRADGSDVGPEDGSSPYSISLDTAAFSNGTHTVSAVARDAAGNRVASVPTVLTVAN